jgi:hypothetical protein
MSKYRFDIYPDRTYILKFGLVNVEVSGQTLMDLYWDSIQLNGESVGG